MNIKNKKPITPPFSLSVLTVSLSDKHLKCGGAKEKAGHEENAHYLNETHTHTRQQKETERVIRGMCYIHGRGKLPWQSLTWLLARGDKHYHTTAPLASSRTPWHTHTHKRAHTSAPQCKHARRLTCKGTYWHNVTNVHTQTHEGVDPIREGNH